MKRTALRRRTPLHRKVRVRRMNPRRLAKRRARDFAEQAAACRAMPCCISDGCDGAVAPHHEPPRSLGGRDRDTVPLCAKHHRQRHDWGERESYIVYGIDLRGLAAGLAARLKEEHGNRKSSNA